MHVKGRLHLSIPHNPKICKKYHLAQYIVLKTKFLPLLILILLILREVCQCRSDGVLCRDVLNDACYRYTRETREDRPCLCMLSLFTVIFIAFQRINILTLRMPVLIPNTNGTRSKMAAGRRRTRHLMELQVENKILETEEIGKRRLVSWLLSLCTLAYA